MINHDKWFWQTLFQEKVLAKIKYETANMKTLPEHQESWVIFFARKFIFKIVKPTTDKTEQHKQWENKHFLSHKNSTETWTVLNIRQAVYNFMQYTYHFEIWYFYLRMGFYEYIFI